MADTWKNDGVRIEELEGRVREFEQLIEVVAETATAMADQLQKAIVVTTAIPMRPSEVALLLERATERDEALAHARRWEDKAEEYRANAIRFGDEGDALRARVAELEAVVARFQGAPTATQERARIGIWLRNQSYETQWAGDLDFKKTAARIEAGEHWPKEEGGIMTDTQKNEVVQKLDFGIMVEQAREGIALLLERSVERDEAIAQAHWWEDKAEEYRVNAIRLGNERDVLLKRVAEREARVAELEARVTELQRGIPEDIIVANTIKAATEERAAIASLTSSFRRDLSACINEFEGDQASSHDCCVVMLETLERSIERGEQWSTKGGSRG